MTPVGTPPPFDPELADVVEQMGRDLAPEDVTPEFIAALRRGFEVMETPSDEELSRGGFFDVTTEMTPSPIGGPDVPLLVCTPHGAQAAASIVFLHGGGMVAGDSRYRVEEILDWAEELSLSVVSVDYRLAPETKHPGPVEDCYAGLLWAANSSEKLGCPSDRIILAGSSAGGGLAASTALLARDRGTPDVLGLILMAPMLDDRNNSRSARQMGGLGVWDLRANATGWGALLGNAAGGFHAFTSNAPEATISQQALVARVQWLRRILDRPAHGQV